MSTDKLTAELVLRRSYDPTTQSLKTMPGSPTATQIEISADDGDSILTVPSTALITSMGVEVSAMGMKTVELYVAPEATADSAKIEISPADSGNVWMEVATSTVAADPADVKSSGPKSICARRIRVTAVSGSPVIYLVMQAV